MKKKNLFFHMAMTVFIFGLCQLNFAAPADDAGPRESPKNKTIIEVSDLDLKDLLKIKLKASSPLGIHHTHQKGELMIGFSAMFMKMEGNRTGTTDVDTATVLKHYMTAPTDMASAMVMLDLMYAFSDKVSLMVMLPYYKKSMNHVTRSGMTFRTETEGPGDLRISGLFSILDSNGHLMHLDAGFFLPTGPIDRKDDTPMGHRVLPYPMQIGSGTTDLRMGFTYQGTDNKWSWGSHLGAIIRTGKNKRDYRLGNQLLATLFADYRFARNLFLICRLDGRILNNIHGADPSLNPMMVPTAAPGLRGGKQLHMGAAINYYTPDGPLKNIRFNLEINLPLYQHLDGPQLKSKWMINAGIAKVFDINI